MCAPRRSARHGRVAVLVQSPCLQGDPASPGRLIGQNYFRREESMKPLPKESTPHWHTLPIETVFSRLNATPAGLTGAEAVQRLAEHGPNELQAAHRIDRKSVV